MKAFCIDDTQIRVLPDPDGGEQTIRIQATPFGARLAQALDTAPQAAPGEDGFYSLAHTPELDTLLCNLIELFISLRYCHPHLLQLTLFPQEMMADTRPREALT